MKLMMNLMKLITKNCFKNLSQKTEYSVFFLHFDFFELKLMEIY